jgi:D-glycero-D-manno-heptose 1,7-bisphosphate phosphatase
VKVLVVASGSDARIERAAAGLALRGHAVSWLGPRPAGIDLPLAPLAGWRDVWSARADLVMTGSCSLPRAAIAGWLARAHGMVVSLEHGRLARWGVLERGAWHSLHSHGLIEPAEAEAFRADPRGLDPERLGLWSDEPPPAEPDPSHADVEMLERAGERALARHRGRALRAAAFVDRDGTLVREVGYLADPADLELLPGVADALRSLQAAGLVLIVISNQSGVGRGFFPERRVHEAMGRLRELLRAQGIELDAIYFCPHRPEGGCPCRKPRPGLLERAAEDQLIALRRSVMVGDKLLDAATGHAAGARSVLVRTGYGRDEEQRIGGPGTDGADRPDAVVDDLAAAARTILAGEPD